MREEGEQDLHLIDCMPACSIIVGGHHHKALAGTAGGQCVYNIHTFFSYTVESMQLLINRGSHVIVKTHNV